ncbi:MAG: aminopeptidase, partial [Bacteroidales bacterium]|nr:aminopeptidase [Bacteroidales bacterium]
GKYEANDASAEYLSYVMGVLDKSKVMYQFGELGKVDLGGGGTIASYLSQLGMEIVDMGTGLLSMHSPFEVASKADLYMTYLGYRAFLEN